MSGKVQLQAVLTCGAKIVWCLVEYLLVGSRFCMSSDGFRKKNEAQDTLDCNPIMSMPQHQCGAEPSARWCSSPMSKEPCHRSPQTCCSAQSAPAVASSCAAPALGTASVSGQFVCSLSVLEGLQAQRDGPLVRIQTLQRCHVRDGRAQRSQTLWTQRLRLRDETCETDLLVCPLKKRASGASRPSSAAMCAKVGPGAPSPSGLSVCKKDGNNPGGRQRIFRKHLPVPPCARRLGLARGPPDPPGSVLQEVRCNMLRIRATGRWVGGDVARHPLL